jgi:hypothetical protein
VKKHNDVQSFEAFWPQYLKAHRDPVSRAFHFTGMALSVLTAAALVSCGMVFFLVLAIIPAQLGAKLGHKLSPRKDKLSEQHPDWAALADVKMFGLFLTGRLGAELAKYGELPSVPSQPGFAR